MMIAPKSRQLAAAIASRGRVETCRATAAFDGACEIEVVGDQNRLRRRVVPGLSEKIGRDPFRVGASIGYDQDFGRPRDHVDANCSIYPPLGRGDISIAWTDNFYDRQGVAGRPISQGCDGLRAAHTINLVEDGKLRGREDPGD